MKNIYLHIVTWDGRTKNLTKLQSEGRRAKGEGRMVRKRLTPQVRQSDLICICEVAGKFQTWFSAILPSDLRGIQRLSTHDFDDVR